MKALLLDRYLRSEWDVSDWTTFGRCRRRQGWKPVVMRSWSWWSSGTVSPPLTCPKNSAKYVDTPGSPLEELHHSNTANQSLSQGNWEQHMLAESMTSKKLATNGWSWTHTRPTRYMLRPLAKLKHRAACPSDPLLFPDHLLRLGHGPSNQNMSRYKADHSSINKPVLTGDTLTQEIVAFQRPWPSPACRAPLSLKTKTLFEVRLLHWLHWGLMQTSQTSLVSLSFPRWHQVSEGHHSRCPRSAQIRQMIHQGPTARPLPASPGLPNLRSRRPVEDWTKKSRGFSPCGSCRPRLLGENVSSLPAPKAETASTHPMENLQKKKKSLEVTSSLQRVEAKALSLWLQLRQIAKWKVQLPQLSLQHLQRTRGTTRWVASPWTRRRKNSDIRGDDGDPTGWCWRSSPPRRRDVARL